MILRVLNLLVIGVLVLAAAYVYRIKFDATVQAERLAKLRGELRHERDKVAALRAQWEQLDNPARIEALAKRLFTAAADRADAIRRARSAARTTRPRRCAARADPIGGMIENLEQSNTIDATGTLPAWASPGRMPVGSRR